MNAFNDQEIERLANLYEKIGKYYKVENQCYGTPYRPGIHFKENKVLRRVRWMPKDIENYQDINFNQFIQMTKKGFSQ